MILETLRSSGFRWITFRVKKASLSPSALGDKLSVGQFISSFCLVSFPLGHHATCSSCLQSLGVQKCSSSRAEWNLFSSQLSVFSAAAGFGSWAGAYQHSCCLSPAFFGNCAGSCSWRCLEPPCVGATSKYWWQVEVLPSASHHSQVEMKAQGEESFMW